MSVRKAGTFGTSDPLSHPALSYVLHCNTKSGTFGTFGLIRENTISGKFSLTLPKKEANVPTVPPFFQIDFFKIPISAFVRNQNTLPNPLSRLAQLLKK